MMSQVAILYKPCHTVLPAQDVAGLGSKCTMPSQEPLPLLQDSESEKVSEFPK